MNYYFSNSLREMINVIFQNSWLYEEEGDIILSFCKTNNIPFKIMEKEKILELEYKPNTIIIASCDILSIILNDKTDTYDPIFNGFYGTEKIRTTLKELTIFPTFIKPVKTKKFNGKIFINKHEAENIINLDEEIYVSDIIEIINERRILIDNQNNFYGLIPEDLKNKILDRISQLNRFWAIDIAIDKKTNDFIIVEINPTYALGYFECIGISEEEYVNFIFNSFPRSINAISSSSKYTTFFVCSTIGVASEATKNSFSPMPITIGLPFLAAINSLELSFESTTIA